MYADLIQWQRIRNKDKKPCDNKVKTRLAMRRLTYLTAPQLWDKETHRYIQNPHYSPTNACLYIGTEMKMSELTTIVLATITKLPEHKILKYDLDPEELERLRLAAEMVREMKLYIETEPNFDIAYLDYIINKHKVEHQIGVVILDYIELTANLSKEFQTLSGGVGSNREDLVLLGLSAALKEMTRRYDVFILSYTQTTDQARKEGLRDQGAIKGSRALPNKADAAYSVFAPTPKELGFIEPIITTHGFMKTPNMVYHIFKNRGGQHNNVKIFCYQNLSDMTIEDCFVTNDRYELINVERTRLVSE